MGQGTKRKRETAKAPAGSGFGPADGEGAPTDFCLRTHSLGVRLRAGASPAVGMTVQISLGSPPRVVGENEEVGVLDDPVAHGLGRCLLDGFRFSGTIDWIDLEGRRAGITVAGEGAG